MIREYAVSGFCAGAAACSGFKGLIRENADPWFCAGAEARSGFTGLIRENADPGFCAGAAVGSVSNDIQNWSAGDIQIWSAPVATISGVCGAAAGSGFKGLIRENADPGFCAGAAVGSGFKGLIRENADPGFRAVAAAGSGFKGLIRENADLGVWCGCRGAGEGGRVDTRKCGFGFAVHVARRWSGWLMHARDSTLRAAKMICRRQTPRWRGGMISRIGSAAMLLEKLPMREGPG